MPASPPRTRHLTVVGETTLDELSEELLSQALQRGESWAREALWSRHAAPIYRLLARALWPGADAEGLTQAVFLRVFARIRSLPRDEALNCFVYSHAVMVLRRELRKRWLRGILTVSRRPLISDEARWFLHRSGRLVLLQFYSLLDRLSPGDRVIFCLREFERFSYAEMAAVLGEPVSFVMRREPRVSDRVEIMVRSDPLLNRYRTESRPYDVDWKDGA